MSSCLSGGGRAYGIDLDLIKSPSSRSSHSSSPSSTLSESSNSPRAISTKKARTPRKRPNQTYTEAAALLAKIYPNIFSTKNLRKHRKFSKPYDSFVESSELLPPFPGLADAGFLLHGPVPEPPNPLFEPKALNSLSKNCWSPQGIDFRDSGSPSLDDDFDAESILDEEIGEGIDSIMGNLSVATGESEAGDLPNYAAQINPYLGHTMGFGFGAGGNMTRALRHIGNGDWWCSPTVDMQNIVPKRKPPSPEKKKKKKKVEKLVNLDKAEKKVAEAKVNGFKVEAAAAEDSSSSSSTVNLKPALSLKLNFDGVLKQWSGSPFSEAADSTESPADIIARLSDMDLLSEVAGSSGVREASVLRYKEKRRSRLFSKKVRYQVRKVNADRRPRMKASSGRFVKRDGE